MSQADTTTNPEPKAPHNTATSIYKNILWYIIPGVVVLSIIADCMIFHFHYNIGWIFFVAQLICCLGIGIIQLAYKDLTQKRLRSGAVDRDWYDTRTKELNHTAHQLTSDLGLHNIQVRIGLVDVDFERHMIDCNMNRTIAISARILKEFDPDEVEFLLTCSIVSFRRSQFLDTTNFPYILVPFCILTLPFMLLGYTYLAFLCWLPNIWLSMVPMAKHKSWIMKISDYKIVLAHTKNYPAAKSALSRLCAGNTDEESKQYFASDEIKNDLYIAAKELGLVE